MILGDIVASNISAIISCCFRSTLVKTLILYKTRAIYDVKQQNQVFLKINVWIGSIKTVVIMRAIYLMSKNALCSVLKDTRRVKFQNTSVSVSNRGDHTERMHHLLARGTNYSVSIQIKST